MTMRYTHIGLKDQAAAVSRLPWTPQSDEAADIKKSEVTDESWECIGSEPGVSDVCSASSDATRNNYPSIDRSNPTRAADTACREQTRSDASRRKADRSFDSRRLHFVTRWLTTSCWIGQLAWQHLGSVTQTLPVSRWHQMSLCRGLYVGWLKRGQTYLCTFERRL